MLRKRVLSFALCACLVITPALTASASSVQPGDTAQSASEETDSGSGGGYTDNQVTSDDADDAESSDTTESSDTVESSDTTENSDTVESSDTAENSDIAEVAPIMEDPIMPIDMGGVSSHDYENTFSSQEDLDKIAKGTGDMSPKELASGTDTYAKFGWDNQKGDRSSKLSIREGIATNADVQFDMTLELYNQADYVDFRLISPASPDSYFTLRYDSDYKLYYYTDSAENKVDTGLSGQNKWFTVTADFNYLTHSVNLTIAAKDGEGSYTQENIAIAEAANGLSQLTFYMGRKAGINCGTTIGLDNVTADFTEPSATDIVELKKIDNVSLTTDTYKDFVFPTKVTATLGSGDTLEVDLEKWTSEPAFDLATAVTGSYIWTAQLKVPEGNGNPFDLAASFQMDYLKEVKEHDYQNSFSLDANAKEFGEWGKSMNKTSGTGVMNLSIATEENDNKYLLATQKAGGSRGSRLDLNTGIVGAATVEFDWMPIEVSGGGVGSIMFGAPDMWHPYLTLRLNADNKISVYTEDRLKDSATTQKEFEGMITADEAIDTGMGEANKWFNVKIVFNYVNHTAELTIKAKDAAGGLAKVADDVFTQTIPIEPEANGIRYFAIVMQRLTGDTTFTMGLDNLNVDSVSFNPDDIISIVQPDDVKVAKVNFDQLKWPTSVQVKLGDGSIVDLPLGDWSAEPVFNPEEAGNYVWKAPLVLGALKNPLNFEATFKMQYTLYPFPTYLHNPKTLELEFGQEWDGSFPETVTAFMSNGTMMEIPIDETTWTPIRPFNADEEGIYVYGANVKGEEGVSEILEDQLRPNENHATYQQEGYDFDIFYRINYYTTENRYNANTRSMEYLNRGVYAVQTGGGVYVSWRILATEYGDNVTFEVYRNGEKIADVNNLTNYFDAGGKAGDVYSVAMKGGVVYPDDTFTAIDKDYLSIPMQKPDPQPSKSGEMADYTLNDAGVADVDGDGQYEVIVKWYPTNSFDSGKAVKPSSPTIFDVYEMDGTPLWRLNLGLEMPSGAHFNQFIFYDLDEDGKAELFIKTSDGAITYKPNADGKFDMTDESTIVSYIGDKNVVPGSNVGDNGHMLASTNEYVTVFNGLTGKEIQTIDYVNKTGDYTDWGLAGGGKNDGGNRSARYNMAVAYLPKSEGSSETIPAVLFNRGYYNKTTVAAYTLRDGNICLEWNFVTENDTQYAGKGNHNIATGDLDNDGFDELVIGALALDHDGSVLWAKDGENGQDHQGHADSIHLSAMLPGSTQLYVMTPSEETGSTLNYMVSNAATGARLMGNFFAPADIGRGVAANITPTPGFEFWASNPNSEAEQTYQGGIYNLTSGVLSAEKPDNFSTNWVLYWDGDLLSELGDGQDPSQGDGPMSVFKYDWEGNALNTIYNFAGTHTNNSTKNNPSLTADLFGDWREEVLLPSADNNELRIYMTTEDTEYMIYTLMHDPVYRNAVANQNTSYNQPAHVGFYLGEDNRDEVLSLNLTTPNIRYTTRRELAVDVIEDEAEVVKEFDSLFSGEKGDAIKKATGVSTGADLLDYMRNKVITDAGNASLGKIADGQTKVVDIKLLLTVFKYDEAGNEVTETVQVTEENFPADGLDVVIPYPEGTNGTDYDFAITHMFTMSSNAGQTEFFASVNNGGIEKTEKGLKIHITGTSPFAIAWRDAVKEDLTQKPDDSGTTGKPDDSEPVEENNEEESAGDTGDNVVQSVVPKTGDHMDTAIMIWTAVLIVAAAGAGVFVVRKRCENKAE